VQVRGTAPISISGSNGIGISFVDGGADMFDLDAGYPERVNPWPGQSLET
jgi:hypothetical protein